MLILCYHAVSQEDEHLWRPGLYMPPAVLEERLRILHEGGYEVLALDSALQRLKAHDLPPRSVVLTFDDGGYEFFSHAWPLLDQFGFRVTVYQTTYYVSLQKPVFHLICSYMLWKRRGAEIPGGKALGLAPVLDLRTEQRREAIVQELESKCIADGATGAQKDELARELACVLEIDYQALSSRRMLQLMSAEEIKRLAHAGVDFQLHTHRHRTPESEGLYRQEIQENRRVLEMLTGRPANHFCYPSGVYRREFLPWLRAERVVSATTCDPALASADSELLLLPRFVDTSVKSAIEFESWLAGVGSLLAVRRAASQ